MRGFTFLSVTMLALVSVGCTPTRQPIKTVNVTGKVTLAGKPLSDAEINFVGKDYAGLAKTDASGNYACAAQPGENKIFFAKFPANYDPTMGPGDSGQGGPKNAIPKKFASLTDSKLSHTVPEDDATDVNFDLK